MYFVKSFYERRNCKFCPAVISYTVSDVCKICLSKLETERRTNLSGMKFSAEYLKKYLNDYHLKDYTNNLRSLTINKVNQLGYKISIC